MAKKVEEQEIIIGVTKKQEPKNMGNKNQTSKNNKKKKIKNNKKQASKKIKISSQENKNKIKKRKRINFILKYSTIAVLFIILIVSAMFSPLFNIKTIQVEGNEKITENEIISLSKIQINNNIFQLNKRKIKNQIKQNAYIGEVNIIRKLPSNIVIQIEERKPAYLLEYAGNYIYVDKHGYFLEITNQKLELPILQGASTKTEDFIVGNRLNIEDLQTLSFVAKIMEAAQINEIETLITRIDIAKQENIKLIFETKGKTAYLGDNTNISTKILIIKTILEKEEGKEGEIFVNIDLNKEKPIFREKV